MIIWHGNIELKHCKPHDARVVLLQQDHVVEIATRDAMGNETWVRPDYLLSRPAAEQFCHRAINRALTSLR